MIDSEGGKGVNAIERSVLQRFKLT